MPRPLLRLGFPLADERPVFVDRLDFLLAGYEHEFVRIDRYYDNLTKPDALGGWGGFLGAMQRDEVDTCVDSLYITPERQSAFWMTNPTKFDHIGVLLPSETFQVDGNQWDFACVTVNLPANFYVSMALLIFLLALVNCAANRLSGDAGIWSSLTVATRRPTSITTAIVYISASLLVSLLTLVYQTNLMRFLLIDYAHVYNTQKLQQLIEQKVVTPMFVTETFEIRKMLMALPR